MALLRAVALMSVATASACEGETILTAQVGSFATGPINASGPPGSLVGCSYLIRHEGGVGMLGQSLTLRFSNFSLHGGGACDSASGSSLRVYDGATALSPLIAEFRCSAWSVASSRGAVLLELSILAGQTVPGFGLEWSPSSHVRCFPGGRKQHARVGLQPQRLLCPAERQQPPATLLRSLTPRSPMRLPGVWRWSLQSDRRRARAELLRRLHGSPPAHVVVLQ